MLKHRRGVRASVRWWRLAWMLLLGLLGVTVYGVVIEPARLVERDYAIALSDWPARCDGLRLDVVTDIHVGSPRNGLDKLETIVARLLASDADAVLLAGDYVILSVFMGEYVTAQQIAQRLKPLTTRKPVYAVLGNHDWWKDGHDVSTRFAEAGVRMIDNSAVRTRLRGCDIWLVGLGDMQEGQPDSGRAFSAVRDAAPVLALTHNPDLWPQIRDRARLTIAGHTHGGQIYPWPLPRPDRFTPGKHTLSGWIYDAGSDLFVSPGIGTSIVPMRLGVPPEISRLTLRRRGDTQPGSP